MVRFHYRFLIEPVRHNEVGSAKLDLAFCLIFVLTVKLESHSRLTLSLLEREDLGKEEIPFLNLFPLGE